MGSILSLDVLWTRVKLLPDSPVSGSGGQRAATARLGSSDPLGAEIAVRHFAWYFLRSASVMTPPSAFICVTMASAVGPS